MLGDESEELLFVHARIRKPLVEPLRILYELLLVLFNLLQPGEVKLRAHVAAVVACGSRVLLPRHVAVDGTLLGYAQQVNRGTLILLLFEMHRVCLLNHDRRARRLRL